MMIARIWKGAVRKQDGDAYARYLQETGVAGYAKSPGNNGVWMLRRNVDDRTEFVMFTLWDSLEAVKAFAGDDHETAVFYPEDERFLVQRDLTTAHYEVDTHVGPDVAGSERATRRPGPATGLPEGVSVFRSEVDCGRGVGAAGEVGADHSRLAR
jgi:heme-degrading monooxygenase HmoA